MTTEQFSYSVARTVPPTFSVEFIDNIPFCVYIQGIHLSGKHNMKNFPTSLIIIISIIRAFSIIESQFSVGTVKGN
jgi:hypothetical protein